jgi:hypothetical protein
MGHSIGDGVIVVALVGAFLGYFYLKQAERRRRLEIVHQERLVAMDKGIPLPELPLDPPNVPKPPNPHNFLVHGIVWTALGFGSMIALLIGGPRQGLLMIWPFPLPFALMGVGLMLYYFLAAERAR